MQDETSGWAIGRLPDGDDLILWSEDGGATWRDLSPPGPAAAGRIPYAVFLDQKHAWVTYYPAEGALPEPSVVWRTSDGGQSWRDARPPAGQDDFAGVSGPVQFQFIDPQHGWLMLFLGAGMSHSYVALYQTGDGGENWQLLAEPQDLESGNLHTCCQTGMEFADPRTGLVTFSPGPNERVLVSWTQNSGDSWQALQLPAPAPSTEEVEFNGLLCASHSPALFSELNGLLGVACGLESGTGGQSESFLYSTEDGGSSWDPHPYPGGQLFFLDENLGWALGRDIYETRDGGLTWEALASPGWEGQYNIVTEQLWWFVSTSEELPSLWRSHDGGRTWERVHATLVGSVQE